MQDEFLGVEVLVSWWVVHSESGDGQVLGHVTILNGLNAGSLEGVAPVEELGVVVKGGSVDEASGPSENGGDGVGGGFLSLLVESVVPGDSSMSSFSFHGAIWSHQDGSHETQRSETLSQNVALNIPIVVLRAKKGI